MTGTSICHVDTIDEDPFVTHVVHDGRRRFSRPNLCQATQNSPIFAHTRSIAEGFGGWCQSEPWYHW
jgi:hypothetical protein